MTIANYPQIKINTIQLIHGIDDENFFFVTTRYKLYSFSDNFFFVT